MGYLGWLASKDLHEKRHNNFVEKYNIDPKKCKNCGKIILFKYRKNLFCSHKCAAEYNNPIRYRKTIDRSCLYCGKVTGNKKYIKKFCSEKCKFLYHIEEKIRLNKNIGTPALRKYLIIIRGNFCSCCRLSNWLGANITLEIHHIDGNYKNNKLENLELLCPNCHSLTNTYKGKNKGHGRKFRKY